MQSTSGPHGNAPGGGFLPTMFPLPVTSASGTRSATLSSKVSVSRKMADAGMIYMTTL
jgi:hypothetical protein